MLAAPTSARAPAGDGPASGKALIEFLDVGQGDAILIRSPEGKAALIDAGPSKRVVDSLRETGLEQLDIVVVTHHHTDHFGGMDDVINQWTPKYFLATLSGHNTSTYVKLLEDVKKLGIQAITPKSDGPRTIHLGSLELIVLPQPPEDLEEENDNSIAIRVSYGNLHILMTGDSEGPARDWWMRTCPELLRDCQILKLAHHGSHNGTDRPWLNLVKPRLTIASLASGNSYGHPHRETLDLLSEYGIPLLRTDYRGTIRIETDGNRTDITSTRGALMASKTSPGTHDEKPVATSSTSTAPDKGPNARKVNLNTASRRTLEAIPGIDSAVSREIIRNRPYQSLSDLEALDILSTEQVARIQARAVVR